MSQTEEKVMSAYKDSLENNDEIPEKLISSLCSELEKENPNVERLANIIKLKKEYLQGDD